MAMETSSVGTCFARGHLPRGSRWDQGHHGRESVVWSMESSVTWGVEAKAPHSNDRDGAWENPGPIGKEKAVVGEEVAAEQDGSAVEGVRASD